MNNNKQIRIGIVGCGFVADYYMANIDCYPNLKIVGVFDINKERLTQFTNYYDLTALDSYDDILTDNTIDIVLNLTDPRAHYEVSKRALEANKNVYSEKPLAMSFEDAKELVDIANKKELLLSSAPCNVLGKSARTLEYAIKQGIIGKVRLIYAELDDGLVHKMPYKKWMSESGAHWPYRDEFEVGCTLEHAGYHLGWMIKIFGNVSMLTAFSDVAIKDKVPDEPCLEPSDAADISIGVLKFQDGTVARISTTIVAPHDHTIRIFGDEGVITLNECWDNDDNVYYQKYKQIRRKRFLNPIKRKVKLPFNIKVNKMNKGNTKMDFLLGVNELAESIQNNTSLTLDSTFSLHVTEIALALQYSGSLSGMEMKSKAFESLN
jgi:predicted dehydrogenase